MCSKKEPSRPAQGRRQYKGNRGRKFLRLPHEKIAKTDAHEKCVHISFLNCLIKPRFFPAPGFKAFYVLVFRFDYPF